MKGKKSTEEKDLNDFIERCKDHKLKVTPQRIAIYRAVLDSLDHPSAEVIYKNIKDRHPGISFDTVNRTLLIFAEMGLIQIVEGTGDSRRFDIKTDPHHHVRCIRCGTVMDFYYDRYNDLEIPEEIRGTFSVKRVRVVIEGICKNCLLATEGKVQ